MGDGADALTESGMDAWVLHLSGRCDTETPCMYCQVKHKAQLPRNQDAAPTGTHVPNEGT